MIRGIRISALGFKQRKDFQSSRTNFNKLKDHRIPRINLPWPINNIIITIVFNIKDAVADILEFQYCWPNGFAIYGYFLALNPVKCTMNMKRFDCDLWPCLAVYSWQCQWNSGEPKSHLFADPKFCSIGIVENGNCKLFM